ncbi:MAG: hypothetical protein NC337_00990 [Roseburia sp.]|nr:hypothetical protein [Roseburia sp.]
MSIGGFCHAGYRKCDGALELAVGKWYDEVTNTKGIIYGRQIDFLRKEEKEIYGEFGENRAFD